MAERIEIRIIGGDMHGRTLSLTDVHQLTRRGSGQVLYAFMDRSVEAMIGTVAPSLPGLVRDRDAAHHERRIEGMVEAFLDVDPFAQAESRIDLQNAELRARFSKSSRCSTAPPFTRARVTAARTRRRPRTPGRLRAGSWGCRSATAHSFPLSSSMPTASLTH